MIDYHARCPSCSLVVRWVSTLTHRTPFDKEVPVLRIECRPCDERDRRQWRVAA